MKIFLLNFSSNIDSPAQALEPLADNEPAINTTSHIQYVVLTLKCYVYVITNRSLFRITPQLEAKFMEWMAKSLEPLCHEVADVKKEVCIIKDLYNFILILIN